MEVDVPILSRSGSIDLHIDLVHVEAAGKNAFLHSSAEYGMKQLLAQGIGDIYQLSHVFRDKEISPLHQIEFTMVEWYRIGMPMQELIEETLDYLRLFIDDNESEMISYDAAINRWVTSEAIAPDDLDFVFATQVQPHLGQEGFTVLIDFPPEQAALAKVIEKGGKSVAMRFEIFYRSMELANGYEELIDAKEQRMRLVATNAQREKIGKCTYPLDEGFLSALQNGIPPCSGVAVGFDRLMMLHLNEDDIEQVLPINENWISL